MAPARYIRLRAFSAMVALSIVLSVVVFQSSAHRARAAADVVDVAIVIAVDCSWSVDSVEFRQQMEGTARALLNPEILQAIQNGPNGRIAISLIQWAGPGMERAAMPWTVISNAQEARAAASFLAAVPRLVGEGATSITSAIVASHALLLEAPFQSMRRVIDISSDGYNNAGGFPDPVRDRTVAAGITINALTILNEYWYLDKYYANHVIGGPGHFVETADDYTDYARAIRRKLLREIGLPLS